MCHPHLTLPVTNSGGRGNDPKVLAKRRALGAAISEQDALPRRHRPDILAQENLGRFRSNFVRKCRTPRCKFEKWGENGSGTVYLADGMIYHALNCAHFRSRWFREAAQDEDFLESATR
jgi:hypothetical protein